MILLPATKSQYSVWAKKQTVLNSGVLALRGGEEGGETGQPFLGAGHKIVGGKGIGQLLERLGIGATQEGVAALAKADSALAQAPS